MLARWDQPTEFPTVGADQKSTGVSSELEGWQEGQRHKRKTQFGGTTWTLFFHRWVSKCLKTYILLAKLPEIILKKLGTDSVHVLGQDMNKQSCAASNHISNDFWFQNSGVFLLTLLTSLFRAKQPWISGMHLEGQLCVKRINKGTQKKKLYIFHLYTHIYNTYTQLGVCISLTILHKYIFIRHTMVCIYQNALKI